MDLEHGPFCLAACLLLGALSACDAPRRTGATPVLRNANDSTDAGQTLDASAGIDAAHGFSPRSDAGAAHDADATAPAGTRDASADAAAREGGAHDAAGETSGSLLPPFGSGFTELVAPVEGTFDLSLPLATSSAAPGATWGHVADIDGDGAFEVILTSEADRLHPVLAYDAQSGGLVAKSPLGPTTLVAVEDLDDDGNVDLLTGNPFGVAWGLGGGAFAASNILPGAETRQVTFDDVDRDGWLDLVVAVTDPSAPKDLALLLRTGPRTYADHSDALPATSRVCSYAVLSGELHARERLLMALGYSCSGASVTSIFRETGVDAVGYPTFEVFNPFPPLPYIDHALTDAVPMGGAIGDVDDDGFADLSLSLDLVYALLTGGPGFPLVDVTQESGLGNVSSDNGKRMLPWGTAFVDVDQDGREDVVTAHGNDNGAWTDPSLYIGPQRATIHWNAGGRSFIDATDALGVGRMGQWEALTVADIDRDGDADLVVGGQGELPRVYRNDIARNHGFALRLHGTSSNALGLGAIVSVTLRDGGMPSRYVAGGIGSPFVQSEPLVFVGLGAATSGDRVTVTWPSGTVQELRDVPAGGVRVVTEPPLFVVSPPSRHLPADGTSEAVILVSPRDPTGGVALGHAVTVTQNGPGTLLAPKPIGDGTFEVRVVAPSSPGSTALTISVDGVAAGVRPRLFWD